MAPISTQGFSQTWHFVGAGKTMNISGIAPLEEGGDTTRFVVVHDNKKKGEPRIGIVSEAVTLRSGAFRTVVVGTDEENLGSSLLIDR